MSLNFSRKMTVILRKCEDRTRAMKRFIIEPEDIIHAILSEDYLEATKFIRNATEEGTREMLLVIRNEFKEMIMDKSGENGPLIIFDITESPETKRLFIDAQKISGEMHSRFIEPQHVIAALFNERTDDRLKKPFIKAGFSYRKFIKFISHTEEMQADNERIEIADSESDTPVADYLCKDLTQMAIENQLDAALNRDDEIQRIIQILGRRKKNNPVLIGKPGVGKTAIVEAIAQRIVENEVPEVLKNKRLLSLDMGMMVAGTKYRGQFEERMKSFIKELEANDNIILFIDELHNIIGTGSAEGSIDAANMLKPQLSRGLIHCIGATTLKEYRKYIEKDGALERRFQQVMIKEMSETDTLDILKRIKHKYEDYHNVHYTPEAIESAVELSVMYITDRVLPDKAIDVIDEAGSKLNMLKSMKISAEVNALKTKLKKTVSKKEYFASLGKYTEAGEKRNEQMGIEKKIKALEAGNKENTDTPIVDEIIVKEVVSLWTGIPVDKLSVDSDRDIGDMENKLNRRIVGQEHVIRVASNALKLTLLGLKDNLKPKIAFLFIGPSGVGKTYLAREIADHVYDKPDSFMRFDMSEYSLEHEVEKLIGSPPGYVGYEEGGRLTEFVRRNPYSLLLFDEIEKANPNIYNIFLQILDNGELNDSFHRKVDFRNTIIIFTSNIGTLKKGEYGSIGFSGTQQGYNERDRQRFLDETKNNFRPEFLNRLDNIIVFNRLSRKHIERIFEMHLKDIAVKYASKGFNIEFNDSIAPYLAENDYNPEYGARVVNRSIEERIENLVTAEILKDTFPKNSTIAFTVKKNKIVYEYFEEEKIRTQEEI